MNEKLLHFIWQFQYFNHHQLTAESGEPIQIIHPGIANIHQGPDFLEAKIRIGSTLLAGSVEIHIKTSDWHLHKHHLDQNYNNVILHVVWENDKPDFINQKFQTLCIQPHVSSIMLKKYEELMHSKAFVPCESYLPVLNEIEWLNWKERLATSRLQRKSQQIIDLLHTNNGHWEETFWQLIAANFGIKVNAEIFMDMAKLISINILAKHKYQIHQVEALLFGTLNLLPAATPDDYTAILKREYAFLARKFNLRKTEAAPLFLRMRPASFPSIRLAQLAALIHASSNLFSKIRDTEDFREVYNYFEITANDYWHYHYRLGDDPGDYKPKKTGRSMVNNIFINTVVPALFAYGVFNQLQYFKDKALRWLEQTAAENNTVIKSWKRFHVQANNALETQALLELKKQYCDVRRCLDCNVGRRIVSAK